MSLSFEDIRSLHPEEKINSFDRTLSIINGLRLAGIDVVIVPGVFDILHIGHVRFLTAAREIGIDDASLPAQLELGLPIDMSKFSRLGNNVVVAATELDETVRRNKGVDRPVNPAADRCRMLAEFTTVDLVCTFDDMPRYDHPEDYVERYELLNGATAIAAPHWDPFLDLKRMQAAEAGTNIAVLQYEQFQNSTTQMLQRLGYAGM